MELDFDDKIELASQVINKLFAADNKSSSNDDRAGKVVGEVLNEGGYDTDTVISDLEDANDSSIMDDIMNNITEKLRIPWNEKTQQLFYNTLNDIFTNSVTDYHQLIADSTQNTEVDITKKSSKAKMKQFTDLTSNELANVVEYIINNIKDTKEFVANKRANLYFHKDNIINYMLSQNWNGCFDFESKTFTTEISKVLQQTISSTALEKLRKEIVSFDMKLFDSMEIKQFALRPVVIRKDAQIQRASKTETKSGSADIATQKQNEVLDKMHNRRFYEIVEQAITLTNNQIAANMSRLQQNEIMSFLKSAQGLNADTFKPLNKKTFSDIIVRQSLSSTGTARKLFYQIRALIVERKLSDLKDDEFYFLVAQGIDAINQGTKFKDINSAQIVAYFQQIGLNGRRFVASSESFENKIQDKLAKGNKKRLYKYLTKTCDIEATLCLMPESKPICNAEMKQNANNQMSKPRILKPADIEAAELINFDMAASCTAASKLSDCEMMQLRYCLQYVMLSYNKSRKKEKQILNMDQVIAFLCYEQQMDGPKICSMALSDFAYLLFDNVAVLHCPGKKILEALKNYNFEEMSTNYSDLNLPFVVKRAIRQQQKKMDEDKSSTSTKLNENEILWAMQFKKYSFVKDRRLFVDFLKNECHILTGPSIKLRNCITKKAENKENKSEPIKIAKIEKKEKPIFGILNKYRNINECSVYDLKQIIMCCVEAINRENLIIDDYKEIFTALDNKNNAPKIVEKLQECDHNLFVQVCEQCIDIYINKLIENGKFKNTDNSLGCDAIKMKVLNYIKSSNISGSNFLDKFAKGSRFAKHLFDVCCFNAKKQKGIKSDLMRVYAEIINFDYKSLSNAVESEIKKEDMKKMDGKAFVNNFKSKQEFAEYINSNTSIKNTNALLYLYDFVSDGFFKWNGNCNENNNYFMNLLYLFASKKYGIKIFLNARNNKNYCSADEKLKQLNGKTFINDTQFTHDMFCNLLMKSKIFDVTNGNKEIALNIYDDLMQFNLNLKGITKIKRCNHNELIFRMRKYILPQFNKHKSQKYSLNKNIIIKILQQNVGIEGNHFNIQNRKCMADKLHHKHLKLGPLRKLSHDIDKYDVC